VVAHLETCDQNPSQIDRFLRACMRICRALRVCPRGGLSYTRQGGIMGKHSPSIYIEDIGTVRVCVDCGCLVAGGPTRCTRCVVEGPPKPPLSDQLWRIWCSLWPQRIQIKMTCRWLKRQHNRLTRMGTSAKEFPQTDRSTPYWVDSGQWYIASSGGPPGEDKP
jgi:hypothetical protein